MINDIIIARFLGWVSGMKKKSNNDKHRIWLAKASALARRPAQCGGSPHPVVRVGAILVDAKGRAIGKAVNRFARGVNSSRSGRTDTNGRSLWINCAEQLAIAAAARHRANLKGAQLYVTLEPCAICAGLIAELGIREVFVPIKSLRHSSRVKTKWKNSIKVGLIKLAEAGVKVSFVDVD